MYFICGLVFQGIPEFNSIFQESNILYFLQYNRKQIFSYKIFLKFSIFVFPFIFIIISQSNIYNYCLDEQLYFVGDGYTPAYIPCKFCVQQIHNMSNLCLAFYTWQEFDSIPAARGVDKYYPVVKQKQMKLIDNAKMSYACKTSEQNISLSKHIG